MNRYVRWWICGVAALCVVGGTSVLQAAIYFDDFETYHDFTTGNVTGTMWDGVLNAANLDATSDTAGGVLNWRNTGEGWDTSAAWNTGPVLYKTVSGDFDVSVQVASNLILDWSDGGLMVRAANLADAGPGEDWITLKKFRLAGNATRGLDDGAAGLNYGYGVDESFIRIRRTGSTLEFYTRPNEASPWALRDTRMRADLVGVDLQVGLWYGTFSGNAGYMQFDNFQLATGAPAIVHWRFEDAPTAGSHTATNNIAISDSSGSNNPLWYWDGGAGNNYAWSADVPPAEMTTNLPFDNTKSFNSGATANGNGVLFFERSIYGDDFALTDDFTIEGYFKTDGTQVNPMEIVFQGQGSQTFLVRLNEVPGELRFAMRSASATPYGIVGLTDRNYADGQWHYFAARYDNRGTGVADELSIVVMNEDGSISTASSLTDPNFVPATTNANMFIGRNYHIPVTMPFRGLIDELRITSGLVADADLLAAVPEPSSLFIVLAALPMLGFYWLRRRK